VILANGAGAIRIAQAARAAAVRAARPGHATCRCRHAAAAALGAVPRSLPDAASGGVVSAGATYDLDADPRCAPPASRKTWSACAACCPIRMPAPGRAAGGPRRLPLHRAGPAAAGRRLPDFDAAGSTERLRDVPRHPGLYGLLGYASRGLIWAPLCAELLAAQLERANRCRWNPPGRRPRSGPLRVARTPHRGGSNACAIVAFALVHQR
jgi:tRNA 5-methylaminomethyl-2-thiouridine biosynthesis bifunctional protein